MRNQLVITEKHLSRHGEVDALSILETLASYRSTYYQRAFGGTLKEFEQKHQVKEHVVDVNVRQIHHVWLRQVCVVETEMVHHCTSITFRQRIMSLGGTDIFTANVTIRFIGKNGTAEVSALNALDLYRLDR